MSFVGAGVPFWEEDALSRSVRKRITAARMRTKCQDVSLVAFMLDPSIQV
jgi:hypothetical protein